MKQTIIIQLVGAVVLYALAFLSMKSEKCNSTLAPLAMLPHALIHGATLWAIIVALLRS